MGWRVGEHGWEPDPSDEITMSDVEFAQFLRRLDPLVVRHRYALSPEEEEISDRLKYQRLLRETQRKGSSRS